MGGRNILMAVQDTNNRQFCFRDVKEDVALAICEATKACSIFGAIHARQSQAGGCPHLGKNGTGESRRGRRIVKRNVIVICDHIGAGF